MGDGATGWFAQLHKYYYEADKLDFTSELFIGSITGFHELERFLLS